jgi:hypothetical protein
MASYRIGLIDVPMHSGGTAEQTEAIAHVLRCASKRQSTCVPTGRRAGPALSPPFGA